MLEIQIEAIDFDVLPGGTAEPVLHIPLLIGAAILLYAAPAY